MQGVRPPPGERGPGEGLRLCPQLQASPQPQEAGGGRQTQEATGALAGPTSCLTPGKRKVPEQDSASSQDRSELGSTAARLQGTSLPSTHPCPTWCSVSVG